MGEGGHVEVEAEEPGVEAGVAVECHQQSHQGVDPEKSLSLFLSSFEIGGSCLGACHHLHQYVTEVVYTSWAAVDLVGAQ